MAEEMAKYQTSRGAPVSVFGSIAGFENGFRMAKALSQSTLIPKEYQGEGNISNVMIALEMAQRVGASPMAVMQSLYIVHGKPSWSSTFIISAINTSGRYSPLRFDMNDKKDSCYAWALENETGERLEGPSASIEMAKAEGWFQKNGSKWKTMPELMLRYRAATFFGRLYAPEILNGMRTEDESKDIGADKVVDSFKMTTIPKELEVKPESTAKVEAVKSDEAKPKVDEKPIVTKDKEPVLELRATEEDVKAFWTVVSKKDLSGFVTYTSDEMLKLVGAGTLMKTTLRMMLDVAQEESDKLMNA